MTSLRSREQYRVVFAACLTQFTVIGLLFSYGLFFKVFETEFGWSRTLLSSCSSIAYFMMGLLAILAGRLNDTYGPGPVLRVSGIIYGLGFILLSQVTEPWHLIALFGLFLSVGLSTHDVVTLGTIARWFPRRRGVMTGVVKVGTAAGQVTIPPIAAYLILQYGWQNALMILGGAGAALLLAASFNMKDPEQQNPDTKTNVAVAGLSFKEARRTRKLWLMCAIQFLFFPSLATIPLHIVVHGMDLGMTAGVAAFLLSTMGVSSVVGRLAGGRLVDVIGGKRTMIVCFVPLIIAVFSLLYIDAYWMLYFAIAIYGFAHGGLFTIISPTVAEYFGLRAHGVIFGVIVFCGTIGGAIGPVMAGRIFDVTGSYFYAFSTLAVLACLGLILVMMLPPKEQNI